MEHKKSNINGVIYDTIEEYTINKFVAVGGESIVFKGEKKSISRTYALKFRDMERWEDFFHYEMKTLSRLEQCSTSKLAGVIPEIPSQLLQELYRMIPSNKRQICANLTSPYAHYFCIVEDYIAGCNLYEYCNGDESKGITGHTPSSDASYEQIVHFQRKLLQWTIQFCEIMSHVTEEHRFLHLDIKPENIMVSNETESITVIDFGKSMEIPGNTSSLSLNYEFGDNIGVYGTNGFAAPECCDSPEMRNSLSLSSTGIVDVRSDIFSFGASLWDCINPQHNIQIHSTEQGYFKRDLFNTPKGYIPELEELIIKCTEKNPEDRYQSYSKLKEAAIHTEAKLLERDKPSKTLLALSIITGLLVVLLFFSLAINARRNSLKFEIARNNFMKMAEIYTEHDISEYREAALAYIEARPEEQQSYLDVLEVSYQNDDSVSNQEFDDVLSKCLDQTDNEEIMKIYINTVMQHLNEINPKSISESITIKPTLNSIDCEGMDIARAITNANNNPVLSYDTWKKYQMLYQDSGKYGNALLYLQKMLIEDTNNRKKIASEKEMDESQLGILQN